MFSGTLAWARAEFTLCDPQSECINLGNPVYTQTHLKKQYLPLPCDTHFAIFLLPMLLNWFKTLTSVHYVDLTTQQ